MPNNKIKIGKQTTRAEFTPGSYNEEARSIEVVFATDTPVLRYSWDGPFYEVLDMAGHMTDRSAGSLPVLNNHDRYSGITGIIGRAENVRLENGKWVATVRFSKRDDVAPIIEDIRDGIIQDLSVGYRVLKYEKVEEVDKEIPTYYARKWESNEISFVTVPADHNSKARHQEGEFSEVEVINPDSENQNQNRKMPENQNPAAEPAKPATPVSTPSVDEGAIRSAAVAAERQRVKDITEAVRAAKLDEEFATRHIENGTAIDAVRAAVIAEIAKKDENNNTRGAHSANVAVGTEQIEKTRAAMEEAITHRVNPTTKLDAGREFRGMDLLDMARFSLESRGISTKGWSKREVAQAALGIGERGYHSSSDFPIVLGNTVNRTLRAAYDAQVRTFQAFSRRATASDFKEITRAQISGLVGNFDSIPEGGEYKEATLTEGKETYKLAKYGKKIAITWEALINDDLNAFSRIPQAIAAKAAQKQSDIVYGILLNNPIMADNVALFHASHGNLGTAAAINGTSMSLARAAMRKQKGLENDFINVSPRFLIVGPDKETEAQQLINATIVATKTVDTNVFRGAAEIITEARITGNKWFLAADPSQIDTIEYAFLDGEGELFTEQRTGFDVDGLEIKARMVFAAKAIDHRGLFYNPGA
jgi:phage head maturation protease